MHNNFAGRDTLGNTEKIVGKFHDISSKDAPTARSSRGSLVLVQRECAFTPIRLGFASLADTIAQPGALERHTALQAKTGLGFVAAFRLGLSGINIPAHASSYTMAATA